MLQKILIIKALSVSFAVASILTGASVLAQPFPINRASVDSAATEGNDRSGAAAISPDGRFVGFVSFASNLIAGDTNDVPDIYLHDRATGVTERISIAHNGAQANSGSSMPGLAGYLVARLGISENADIVAFASTASNLVPGDTNGLTDVFVRDRAGATTELISVGLGGKPATGFSDIKVSVSNDGRFVGFASAASNLVEKDNNFIDVFVRDRQTATTELISVATSGKQANGSSTEPSLSADGNLVAFSSIATNFVPGDTNDFLDIYLRDRGAGTTEWISVGMGGADTDEHSFGPAISADGRYIAYYSDATNLVPGDTNAARDVFVYDRQTGTTTRVSTGPGGVEGNNDSLSSGGQLDISGDGRYIVFGSAASNLDPVDTNTTRDAFIHDQDTGETRLFSMAENGTLGDGYSDEPAISEDGLVIAFDSAATTLIAGDTNGKRDVFVIERPRELQRYEYVAKVVCGIQRPDKLTPVIAGAYATTVNIHNPGPEPVKFFKKLALTIPPGFQEPGEIIALGEDRLDYDEALATDCADIQKRAFPNSMPADLIEGYVVIQSSLPLEVDTVYTTGTVNDAGTPSMVTSIDVERVAERDRADDCDLEVAKSEQHWSVAPPNLTQFRLIYILYTIEVTNHCGQAATNVLLVDKLTTDQVGTVNLFVPANPFVADPGGMMNMGPVQVEANGTLSAVVTGSLPSLDPNQTGTFQFWAVAMTYEVGSQQSVALNNEAEVTSDLIEADLTNNMGQTSTPLF